MDNTLYYLGFSHFLGIGPIKIDLLIKCFGDVMTAYLASEKKLIPIVGHKVAYKFTDFRKRFKPQEELQRYIKNNVIVLTCEHKKYPAPLRQIHDPPICLYVKGDLKSYDFDNNRYFAIVGTRKPTSYGAQITKRFSGELASAGFTIVSGMALGIDMIAHESALDVGGRTIAFLGCGVNVIYPQSNHALYYKIIKNGGLVISEFPPDMTVLPGLFVSRNRLISGLSRGVLVAEGQKDSGSLITARCALEQGKEVFAPPAPITSDQSEAPNSLIKEGANLVTCVQDIFDAFSLSYQSRQIDDSTISSLCDEEKSIITILEQEPLTANEIGKKLKVQIAIILPLLSNLELLGIIEKNNSGVYIRR